MVDNYNENLYYSSQSLKEVGVIQKLTRTDMNGDIKFTASDSGRVLLLKYTEAEIDLLKFGNKQKKR